jgi:hypothetical protein
LRERVPSGRKLDFLAQVWRCETGTLEALEGCSERLAPRISVNQIVLGGAETLRERAVRDAALVEPLGLVVRQVAEEVADDLLVGIGAHHSPP